MWALLSALAFGTATWWGRAPSVAWARRAVATSPPRIGEGVEGRARSWPSAAQRERLRAIGVTPTAYARQLALGIGGGIGAGLLVFRNPIIAVVAAAFGVGFQWFRVFARYTRWQSDVASGVPDLVRMLAMRFRIGESVNRACERVVPYLNGALQVEWRRMLAERQASLLDDALVALDHRIGDPNLTAALVRLRTYNRNGPPAEPFGDMAEHLTKIELAQAQSRLERLRGPLVGYVLAGLFGMFLILVLPGLLAMIQGTLAGNPLF